MLDIDLTIIEDRCISPDFDAYLPSNADELEAYFRPGIFEFIRRLANQNVKFGFLTNRSGPFGHSVADFLRYGLAQRCPSRKTRIGPVHEYYAAMLGRMAERNPEKESAFKVPSVNPCSNCTCAVSAVPALEDQLERRVRYYRKANVSKLLTDVFPDREDWDRAILIDDRGDYVTENLGHGIQAYLSKEDFRTGLLQRILPVVEKCVEATREQRQRLGARLKKRKAAAMLQEQQDLATMDQDAVKKAQDAVRTVLDAELNKDHGALPPRWSDFFQARVMPQSSWQRASMMPPPHQRPRGGGSGRRRTAPESIHDLWTHDAVCRTILSTEHGDDGYRDLLSKVGQLNTPLSKRDKEDEARSVELSVMEASKILMDKEQDRLFRQPQPQPQPSSRKRDFREDYKAKLGKNDFWMKSDI
jgi:hypothetical protein